MSEYIQGAVNITAEEARFDQQKLNRIADQYLRLYEAGRIQGAGFLLAREGRIFAHQSLGNLNYETKKGLFKPDSIKRIASMSKVLTAAAVMKLVEDGFLWLEQPVKTIIKEFDTPMHSGINLWHLLTHTSGIPADGGYFLEPYPEDRWEALRCENWIKKGILSGVVQNKPGENWNYCTSGFSVLAEVITRVSGMHYHEYMEKALFQPLGMNRSFMEVPEALWPEVSFTVDWEKKRMTSAKERKGAPAGGAGVFSTMYDIFKFAQCFLNGGEYNGSRVLGRKTVEEMTRNQLEGVPAFHWGKNCRNYRQGLGWGFYCDGPAVGPFTYNHEGWGWCSLFIDPVEKFIFISFVPDAHDWDPEIMVKPRATAFAGIL